MDSNHQHCYRALVARDARFDGVFFVGVTTTRIYCRPICSARTPASKNCRFFPLAAAAEQAGFRPCLRCRPELAPGSSPVDAVGRVARMAAMRIQAGALNNGGGVEELAGEFGLCSRQLRRVMRQELGVSPVQLAQTHRLLLAKQLLTETRLPIVEVALASGFESVRRFNSLFKSHYRLAPRHFRRSSRPAVDGEPLRLHLAYRPPLAWPELLRFLSDRAVGGVERVSASGYSRTVAIGSARGWLSVTSGRMPNTLCVELAASLSGVLAPLLARLRHLFDLGARPAAIVGHLSGDPRIGKSVKRVPGLRVPGAFDGFELACRAILGQRISVRAATTLAGRLAARYGETIETPDPALNTLAPDPARIAAAPVDELAGLGVARTVAVAMVALARAVSAGGLRIEPGAEVESTIEQLCELPGVGPWTAHYIAMRGLGWPDAFPDGDLGLLRGLGESSAARVRSAAEAWRPWRAYAVMHVWNQLGTPSNTRNRS